MEGSNTARGLIVFVIAAALVGSLLASPAAASNDQGLYWGFSVGQRFDYMLSSSRVVDNLTETSQQRFYVNVSSLPHIRDNVVSLDDLPEHPGHSTYFENGTPIAPPVHLWSALPVGNWSWIIILWLSEPQMTQEDIIETPVLAGFNHTYEIGAQTSVHSEIYQKSTGVLYNLVSAAVYRGDTSYLYMRMEISLIESNSWTVVAVGGAVAVGAIIVVAVIVKRR